MREIKFRAWDKETERMFYPNGATIYEIIKASEKCEDECWLLNTDHILMQYTGLKDKHGKEIYEGDILSWANNDSNPLCCRDIVVKWDKGGFQIPYDNAELWQVIGNIYENPDLLEKP